MVTPPRDALKPRKTPRQARSIATVDAISKAAVQVLLAEGSLRLTTTRVAERAGVSVGTLYQYFPHKQALLYALVQQHLTEYAESFEASCLRCRGQAIALMSQGLVNAYIDEKLRQPDVTRALYKIASELDTSELRMAYSRRLQNACCELLASAADVALDELAEVSFTLLTAMNGTVRVLFEQGITSKGVGMLRKHLQALCHGYLLAAPRTSGSGKTATVPR